jgi:type IV secretory pathway VirJ component
MAFGFRRVFRASVLAGGLCLGFWGPASAEAFPKPDGSGTVEVGLTSKNGTLVIFLSGDGGWWGDLDAQIGRDLADRGYGVVGLDTGIWFDRIRDPQDVARRIHGLIQSYQKRTKARRIILIGYSFGADMVPLAYNRLPASERALIPGLILIAPGRMASLQVTLAERAGLAAGTLDLTPELARLPLDKLRCIYGTDEGADTGCTLDAVKPANPLGLPGGHHFNHDIGHLSAIVQKMADDFIPKGPASPHS